MVDRQGKPVANVEVFQSGDGPENRRQRRPALDGRFSLDGFRQGSVFVFARGEGFRFHGQLIKEGQSEVTVELTRLTERPARAMRMLPEPIRGDGIEGDGAAAGRAVVEGGGREGERSDQVRDPAGLVKADPAGVLEKLESAKFLNKIWEFRVQTLVAVALAGTDPEEASSMAESIADPAQRAGALIGVVDALPATQRAAQARPCSIAPTLHARAAPRRSRAALGDR